jgi:hypothetical protein
MAPRDEERAAQELRRAAERICVLILTDDYPKVDIEIEKANLKRRVREIFPEKIQLYEMIYESRFQRLWEQWRETGGDYPT